MANEQNNDIPASGYLSDVFEAYGREFTGWEELGRSDAFVVWRAQRYGRWWVLKGLRDECARLEPQQQMLRKELEVMMQLQHPLVVQATGLEEVDGHGRCIVMEYVDGVTLDRWLASAPDRAARRRIATLLLEAVAYVHGRGIVHRDLKPTNVIVTAGGCSLKLIDFGLADTASHTVLKQPAGTLGYMSPEQMEHAVPDVRNDIYSLGIILEQMDPGGYYRKPTARCLAPIDRRYANVAELQRAIADAGTARRRWRTAGLYILLAAMLAGAWWSNRLVNTEGDNTATIDSLSRQWEGQRDTLNAANAALRDSLRQFAEDNASMKESQRQRDERRALITKTIANGRAKVDKIYAEAEAAPFYCEGYTLEQMEIVRRQSIEMYVDRKTQEHLDALRKRFNDDEMAEITTAVTMYRNQLRESKNHKR